MQIMCDRLTINIDFYFIIKANNFEQIARSVKEMREKFVGVRTSCIDEENGEEIWVTRSFCCTFD